MFSRIFLLFTTITLALLTGCAVVPEYSGSARSGGFSGQQVLPGMNARTTGAIGGAAVGSLLFSQHPVVGAIIGGIGGSIIGGPFDDRANQHYQYMQQQSEAMGRTNCTASYTGTVSPSGVPTANTSPYSCSFSNSVPGNYNTPPPARRQ